MRIAVGDKELKTLKAGELSVGKVFKGGRVINGEQVIWGLTNLSTNFHIDKDLTCHITTKATHEELIKEGLPASLQAYWFYADNAYYYQRQFGYISDYPDGIIYALKIRAKNIPLWGAVNDMPQCRSIKIDGNYICSNIPYAIFRNNFELTELDLSGITGYTQGLTTSSDLGVYKNMFYECKSLKHIYGLTNFLTLISKTTGKKDAQGMFYLCKELEDDIDFSGINMNLNSTSSMFYNCSKIKRITMCNCVPYYTVSTFASCSQLEYLDITRMSVGSSVSGNEFYGCTSLKDLYISKKFFSTNEARTFDFSSCPLSLESLERLLSAAIDTGERTHTIKLNTSCFNIVMSELSELADDILDLGWYITN